MFTLAKKEITAFFASITGYVVIAVFLITTSLFLWIIPSSFNLLDYGYASLDGFFTFAPYIFLFLLPAITMKAFAEEKKTGTMEFLLTQPLTELQIVIAKYMATMILFVCAILPTFVYVFSIRKLGMPVNNLDMGSVWGSYLGLLLIGSAFASAGLFFSACTNNQMVAFIISVLVCFVIFLGFDLLAPLFGSLQNTIEYLGMQYHYTSVSRGVIDSRDIIYFISLTVVFMLLLTIKLKTRKW